MVLDLTHFHQKFIRQLLIILRTVRMFVEMKYIRSGFLRFGQLNIIADMGR